jgi:acetyl-CoA carboxylase carboxyl transferase subunit beta
VIDDPIPGVSNGRSPTVGIGDLLDCMLDADTFAGWPTAGESVVATGGALSPGSGHEMPVLTGEGCVFGQPVAVIATRFEAFGGTIGVVEGEQLAQALARASDARLPLLVVLASGGVRLQEGTAGFMQLAKITAALTALRSRGLPYIVYLAGPSFGGAQLALGSLGHVTLAAPGALVGFVGPKVYEVLRGEPLAGETQQAEVLVAHGLVDAVVVKEDVRAYLARLLAVLSPANVGEHAGAMPSGAGGAFGIARTRVVCGSPGGVAVGLKHVEPATTWASVTRTREPDRPGLRELVGLALDELTELHGSGLAEEDDPSMFLALGRIASTPVVVIGHDRGAAGHRPRASGLRKARRGLALANELGLAVVTIIDTPGPELDESTERDGFVFELGRCLAAFVGLDTPTLSVLLGQGAGGTALALLPADRILCAEWAWLAPMPPEGSAVVLHGTAERAAEVAMTQRVASWALLEDGIVDEVVVEGGTVSGEVFVSQMAEAMTAALDSLVSMDPTARRSARVRRYRRFGTSIRQQPSKVAGLTDGVHRTCDTMLT